MRLDYRFGPVGAVEFERQATRDRRFGLFSEATSRHTGANAQRSGYNHRRTLSNYIVADSGATRPINVCAHHVVALKDEQAEPSRKKLFDWGIAIDDADNGVFLPRWAGKALPGLPNLPSRRHPYRDLLFGLLCAASHGTEIRIADRPLATTWDQGPAAGRRICLLRVDAIAIWELRCGSVNEFASIVSRDYDNIEDELFDTDGGPKDWKDRPLVGYAVDKRLLSAPPQVDGR